jgi:hypothetical protein
MISRAKNNIRIKENIRFKINKDFFIMKTSPHSTKRAIIYSKKAREIIHNFKEERLFKKILDISKKIGEKENINPTIKFENNNLILIAKRHDNAKDFSCRKTFILELLKTKSKYFIKEGNVFHTFLEHITVKYIEKLGFNIIKPIFSYSSKGKNYIVYDYSNLPTLNTLKNKIPSNKFNKLLEIIFEISYKLAKNKFQLKEKIKKRFPFIEDFKITDIKPTNTFYDQKNDKLYIFDPIISLKVNETKLPKTKYISGEL